MWKDAEKKAKLERSDDVEMASDSGEEKIDTGKDLFKK